MRTPAFSVAAASFGLLLYQLLLTRVLRVVLFADLAAMALSIGMLGLFAGAVLHAARPRDLSRDAVARLVGAQGLSSAVAVALTLQMPLVSERTPLVTWYSRHPERFALLHYHWYALLLLVLVIPGAIGGYVLAATVTGSGRRFGPTYAADLAGGAAAAALFVPALSTWSAPDAVFFVPLVCGAAAAALSPRVRLPGALLATVAGLGLVVGARWTILDVRHAAGWSERSVVWSKWTPVARLALYRSHVVQGVPGDYLLLDNASASLVVETDAQLDELRRYASRSAVYDLRPDALRVAVVAAGAGPDVAIALERGVGRVDAYELAPEIFDVVRDRYRGAPRNPYASSSVRTIVADGRSGVRRSGEQYDVIQLVHGNFVSAGGLLEDAWTPQLLYTREAVGLWLDHLAPDGVLALTTHGTLALASTVDAALAERGLSADQHTLYVRGPEDDVLLVKTSPFTSDERSRAQAWAASHRSAVVDAVSGAPVLTDDHPFPDRAADLLDPMRPIGQLYGTLVVSVLAVGAALAAALSRGAAAVADRRTLGFGVSLGYGFLALEVVATCRLLPFVGHPTYAVNAVLAGAMFGGALGAALSYVVPDARAAVVGRGAAVAVAVVALCSGPVSAVLADAGGLTTEVRALFAAGLVAAPFAVAGLILPLARRKMAAEAFPWVWAVSGWAGVLAGATTLLLVRFFGYSAVTTLSAAAYVTAAVLLPVASPRERPRSP